METAIDGLDQFLVYGGTAIGDALQTAVLLGRQVTDLAPTDQGSVTLPASDHSTRTLAQAAQVRRREEPSLDPLPVGRRSDAGAPAAARRRKARAGGVLPRLHGRARYA